jgi:hypothetical protein
MTHLIEYSDGTRDLLIDSELLLLESIENEFDGCYSFIVLDSWDLPF